jgi:membrane-associated phospholipid phosphatase
MRRLFWITLAPTVGLLVATVYCRYHYALDTLAGMAVGGIVFAVLVRPAARERAKKEVPFGNL